MARLDRIISTRTLDIPRREALNTPLEEDWSHTKCGLRWRKAMPEGLRESCEKPPFTGFQAVRISGPAAYIALYAALYAGFGVASPYWPKFFETRTLVPQQIGLILAAAMVARLVSGPVVGMLADFLRRLRLVFASCAALGAGAAAALIWANNFWSLLLMATALVPGITTRAVHTGPSVGPLSCMDFSGCRGFGS